jgi:hypothetical protein
MAIKRPASTIGKAKAKAAAKKSGKKNAKAGTPSPSVRLFEDFDFGGDYDDYTVDTTYIGDELNKKVSSLVVKGGVWQFYAGKNYSEPVGHPVYPGAYQRTTDVGIPNDSIASMKQVTS